jgi:hypothetical protein
VAKRVHNIYVCEENFVELSINSKLKLYMGDYFDEMVKIPEFEKMKQFFLPCWSY